MDWVFRELWWRKIRKRWWKNEWKESNRIYNKEGDLLRKWMKCGNRDKLGNENRRKSSWMVGGERK